MSAPVSRFAEDVKISTPLQGDVEQGAPPSYPLNEAEELVVGGPEPRCKRWRIFRRNRRCSDNSSGCKKGRKIFRVLKWLLASWLFLSVIHFAVAGIQFHKAYKTLQCTAITPAAVSGGIEYTLPVHSPARFIIHDSLSGGDSIITHDSAVANGTVQVSLKFSDSTEQDDVFDGCVVQLKHATAVALIPRERHGARAEIASFTLRFPTSVKAPAVKFLRGDKHLSDRKLRKLIKWWRKHQDKKEFNLLGDE